MISNSKIIKKTAIDTYPGIVSSHFSYIARFVDAWLRSKNFVLTHEFWFLLSIATVIILEKFLPKLSNFSLIGILILLMINLTYTNIGFLKKRFFKSSDQKLTEILNSNEQKALELFKTYMDVPGDFGSEKINLLFKEKFANNYAAYLVMFKNTRFVSEDISWFIKNKTLKKKFFDDFLIRMFIKSLPFNISFESHQKLKQILKTLSISKKTIRLFNYKYIRYTNHKTGFKNTVVRTNKIIYFFQSITFIVFILSSSLIFFMLLLNKILELPKQQLYQLLDIILPPLGIFFAIIIFSWIISSLVRFFFKRFIKSSI